MKQYVIDELRPEDYEKLKSYMDANVGASGMEGIYWLELEHDILSDIQKAHTDCLPFYFVIALDSSTMVCEFLVRTKNKIRCECIAYATEQQRNWLIRRIDAVLETLGIIS